MCAAHARPDCQCQQLYDIHWQTPIRCVAVQKILLRLCPYRTSVAKAQFVWYEIMLNVCFRWWQFKSVMCIIRNEANCLSTWKPSQLTRHSFTTKTTLTVISVSNAPRTHTHPCVHMASFSVWTLTGARKNGIGCEFKVSTEMLKHPNRLFYSFVCLFYYFFVTPKWHSIPSKCTRNG